MQYTSNKLNQGLFTRREEVHCSLGPGRRQYFFHVDTRSMVIVKTTFLRQ